MVQYMKWILEIYGGSFYEAESTVSFRIALLRTCQTAFEIL